MSKSTDIIPQQVRLPIRMAVDVAMQGIRIRFGRSVVTIMGVVFGIAFLMSIFTGQVLRSGVSGEEELRTNVQRMLSFITAETGPVLLKEFGVIISGELSDQEVRLLERLDKEGAAKLRVAGDGVPDSLGLEIEQVGPNEVGEGSAAVFLLGGFPVDWNAGVLLTGARQNVLGAFGRKPENFDPNFRYINLGRELTERQIARMKEEERRATFRNNWIVIISLLVTVIGVSNAMLMSVTERFREIGTMKCLGALSGFVRTLFLIESGFMGTVGGAAGCVVGILFSLLAYAFTYGFGLVFLALSGKLGLLMLYALISLAVGIFLSVLAAIYPATVASNMVPATALRSNV